jgi:peptidase M28-like protein
MYRDELHVPGLDFAYVRDGYVYHTPLDSVQHVPSGSLQHAGDNGQALIQVLGHRFGAACTPPAPAISPLLH